MLWVLIFGFFQLLYREEQFFDSVTVIFCEYIVDLPFIELNILSLVNIERQARHVFSGIPMQVKMMTSLTARVAKPPEELEEGGAQPLV